MKLAIDIGFSSVKVVGDGICFKFTSAVAVYNKPSVDLGYAGKKTLEYNGEFYLIGEDAIGEPHIKYSLEIDYLIEYAPLFIAKAIEIAEDRFNFGGVSEIVLGLPIEYYKLKRMDLWNKVKLFNVNGRRYQFFSRVNDKGELLYPVFAQGAGVLRDYIEKYDITVRDKASGFVLDVGFNTVLVVSFEDYAAKSDNSKQYTKLGISKAISDIEQSIIREYGIDDETKVELSQILMSKTITNYGEKIDLTEKINKAMANYIDSIFLRIQTDYEKKFRQSDKLIIAGGGAYYIKDSLPEKYKNLVTIMDAPEYSNARGFYLSPYRAFK